MYLPCLCVLHPGLTICTSCNVYNVVDWLLNVPPHAHPFHTHHTNKNSGVKTVQVIILWNVYYIVITIYTSTQLRRSVCDLWLGLILIELVRIKVMIRDRIRGVTLGLALWLGFGFKFGLWLCIVWIKLWLRLWLGIIFINVYSVD